MNLHVSGQSPALRKSLSAHATNIRPLPRVRPHVLLQRPLNRKTPAALPTRVRFLPTVHPHVNRQPPALIKSAVAHLKFDLQFSVHPVLYLQ